MGFESILNIEPLATSLLMESKLRAMPIMGPKRPTKYTKDGSGDPVAPDSSLRNAISCSASLILAWATD
jgi:hypothetical protein